MVYQFKGDTSRKRSDDFKNGIKVFVKIKSVDIKLQEAEKSSKCV